MPKRSIKNDEISLIRAMLEKGMANKDIQFFFNRPDRAVNSGRITGIKDGSYGPNIAPADPAKLSRFLDTFKRATDVPGLGTANSVLTPEEKILGLFKKSSNGEFRFSAGEDDTYECKQSFSRKGHAKFARAVAGLSNNRGGAILFGVKDKPDHFEACGLGDAQFMTTDTNIFTQIIRSCFQPTPKFRVTSITLPNDRKIGLLLVEPHPSKPVIATKNEGGQISEGSIYYRYPGETRPISYADLRSLLDERDKAVRQTILPQLTKLLEVGPDNALVADLADGTLSGGPRPIVMDSRLLDQIKLIKQGEFDEKDGAPTLRIIGDVSIASNDEKLVREELTEEAILRNFLERNEVSEPLAYFRQASHEAAYLLPIFYYLHLAGQTRGGAIASLQNYKAAKAKTKSEIIKRLSGRRDLYAKVGGTRAKTLDDILEGKIDSLHDRESASEVLKALTGLKDAHSGFFERANGLVLQALDLWDGDRNYIGELRRAASRIDELVYGPLVTP